MRKLRRHLFTWQVRRRFPGWRLDWVGVNKATLTRPDGEQYLMVFPTWSWEILVTWLVPAVIWLWGMWMVCVGLLMLWKG